MTAPERDAKPFGRVALCVRTHTSLRFSGIAELRRSFASGLGMARDPGVGQEFTQPIDGMGRQPYQDSLEVGGLV
jgi:hypothetical protein